MNQPTLVSIIINNFNYGRFLVPAIESALVQTYPRVEVIVVDDGSSDNSRQIIEGYHQQVVSLYKINGGQSSTLNAGFHLCHGEVVIFLDADDVLLPTTAEDVVGAFEANPELSRVQYCMAVIDEQGHRTGVMKPEPHIPMPVGDIHRQALTFPFDLPWLPTSGNAFSARFLHQVMPIPADRYGSAGADWYLVHLSALLGPVAFLDRVEACYRVHPANLYERGDHALNLDHIHQTIHYAHVTAEYLQAYASRKEIQTHPGEILSVSDIANRLVSFRLDVSHHPVPADSRWGLVRKGLQAASRRFDISLPMKLLFGFWFVLMGTVPQSWALDLARLFLFPSQRRRFNKLLGKFHLKSVVNSSLPLAYREQK